MLNKQTRNDVSFEGKGTLIIEHQKYSEEIGKSISAWMKGVTGKTVENIKTLLTDIGAITENGDMPFLPPKKVTIHSGSEYFDEALIQDAKMILQHGGKIEQPIKADYIVVKGGENVGLKGEKIVLTGLQKSGELEGQTIHMFNTTLNSPKITTTNGLFLTNVANYSKKVPTEIFGQVSLKNSRLIHTSILGPAHLKDSVIEKSNIVGATGLRGKSSLSEVNVNSIYKAEGTSQIIDSRIITSAHLKGQALLKNSTVVKSVTAEGRSKIVDSHAFNYINGKENSTIENSTGRMVYGYDNANFTNVTASDTIHLQNKSQLTTGATDNLVLEDASKATDVTVENNVIMSGVNNVTAKGIRAKQLFIYGTPMIGGNIQGKIEKLSKGTTFLPSLKLDETARGSLPVHNWETFKIKYGKANRMSV